MDRRFIQQQVGHERDSSPAICTRVSDDFMSTSLHKAQPRRSPASDEEGPT
ncbi:hypothetical protein [Streptomyces sp. NPDC090080]|uniref:hypothetical protein n=1 Tax=Streptomyces sp. NPDC090080 TaxID=3365939 RepID=UPI00381C0548